MILSVGANHKDFQSVSFSQGLNIVLANRESGSTEKDSRNGLGKSSLLSVIHWLLGASDPPKVPQNGHKYEFRCKLLVRDKTIEVVRQGTKNSNLIVRGLPDDWHLGFTDDLLGEKELSAAEWSEVLLCGWFGLNPADANGLTFRSLISYLIRKDPDGYADFRKNHPNQPLWNQQASLAFLLGLDWTYPVALHHIKEDEKQLQNAAKLLKSDVGAEILNTPTNMENQKVQIEITIERFEKALEGFRVHDEYRELEIEANKITEELAQLANRMVTNRAILSRYSESIVAEVVDNKETILEMYEQVGIVMPNAVVQRLDAVVQFNQDLLSNRKQFLKSEIEGLEREIKQDDLRTYELSNRRASVMGILNTHGALDEYNRLHDELAEAKRVFERLTLGIETNDKIETKKRELRVLKSELDLKSSKTMTEQRPNVDHAIRLFTENTQQLYDQAGQLHVNSNIKGLQFDVDIDRTGSHGVGKMKTFSFDLTVAQIWADRDVSPRVLAHDSVIFDGVDARQIAAALELIADSTEAKGFQYICFLNSDHIPTEDFTEGFSIDPFVKLTLSDSNPAGTLFGHRF